MYELKFDRFGHKAGTIVYDCFKHDYGLVNDDDRLTGIEHVAVTLDPSGDYPLFTIPKHDLKEVN